MSTPKEVSVFPTILSKTEAIQALGCGCAKQRSNGLFTDVRRQSQVPEAVPHGCLPCPERRLPKAVLDESVNDLL
jgi:hypothetical protein